ncbi:hypothetical protein DFH27DRAFT_525392 [Peziza echinospora]|nr:hypothetical protein DFH27DRAFT_525392 [Peziza echinospora]
MLSYRGPEVYKSPIFELIVHPQEDDPELPQNTPATKGKVTYFVHKDILAAVSPELHKHAYNIMREGETNSMVLVDVDEDTLRIFVKWMYEGDIPVNIEDDITAPFDKTEFHRTKYLDMNLYIFGDRFNIIDLQNCAIDRIARRMQFVLSPKFDQATNEGIGPVDEDKAHIFDLITYAYANLPFRRKEPLLTLLANFAAYRLDTLKGHPRFRELSENSDLSLAILRAASPSKIWRGTPSVVATNGIPDNSDSENSLDEYQYRPNVAY